MKKVHFLIIILIILSEAIGFSETSGELSFTMAPTAVMPLGEGANYFAFDAGGCISFELYPPGLPLIGLKAEATYGYIPLVTKDAVSLFSVRGGIEFNLLLSILKISPYATAGYYYGLLMDGSGRGGGNLSAKGGLSIYLYLTPFFSLGLDGYYLYDLALYNGAGGSLTLSYHIPLSSHRKQELKSKQQPQPKPAPLQEKTTVSKTTETEIKISTVKLNPVFPVLFKHYNSFPLGAVVIHNGESIDATDITVSFFVEKYMDNPKECGKVEKLEAGKDVTVNLYALFSDSVLEITEGTKVSAKILLSYTLGNKKCTLERTAVLDIYDRNATTWDDNRKAAAFVTAKEGGRLDQGNKEQGFKQ